MCVFDAGSPAGELSWWEAAAGDTLAVTTVVTLVDLTGAAGELGQTATELRAVLTLETGAFVQTVAFTASCEHTRGHTHTQVLFTSPYQPCLVIFCSLKTLTVLALVTQEVSRAATGRLVSCTDCTVSSILTIILTRVQGTVRSSEASQASTCRRTWWMMDCVKWQDHIQIQRQTHGRNSSGT